MPFAISASFAFETQQPTDVLLQFEAASKPAQRIVSASTDISDTQNIARVSAEDTIGERIWMQSNGRCEVQYHAKVELDRASGPINQLTQVAPHKLPGEAVKYLFDSRYCQTDHLQDFAESKFGLLSGGSRILAMQDWIASQFEYAPGVSDTSTTAADSFAQRRGVCRDYAHVLITLARASAIPARFVSCYAPHVTPQDFHAVAQVFLENPLSADGGAWHLVDATNMAGAADIIKIGVGRDAADVSFLTSFGPSRFLHSDIKVTAG